MVVEARPSPFVAVAARDFGGLPSHLRRAPVPLQTPTAGGNQWQPEERRGPAWSDSTFLSSLRNAHRRMGAGPRSFEMLEALAEGAPCVITGQQPGLGGGPLYTWWKIAGAVAVARAHEERLGRPVAPVFWCASDDSDFDEVRTAIVATLAGGAQRFRLPATRWQAGQMVGSLSSQWVADFEAGLEGGAAACPSAVRDWGEAFGAQMLADFAQSGLVVVDAREPTLVARGQELFRRGQSEIATLRRHLTDRRRVLASLGWPSAIADRSLESAVFRLVGQRRERVTETSVGSEEILLPSVLLRALWQDQELGPLATILGPGELAYQAQLQPLYTYFAVQPPRTLPRPHLAVLPPLPGPEVQTAEVAELLASAHAARNRLGERGLDPRLATALGGLSESMSQLLEQWSSHFDGALRRSYQTYQRRVQREGMRLHRRALARSAPEVQRQWQWLWPLGRVQERTLAVATLRARGWTGDRVVDLLGDGYCKSLRRGRLHCGAFLTEERMDDGPEPV